MVKSSTYVKVLHNLDYTKENCSLHILVRENVSTKFWRSVRRLYTQEWNCWGLGCKINIPQDKKLSKASVLIYVPHPPAVEAGEFHCSNSSPVLENCVEICSIYKAEMSIVSLQKHKANRVHLEPEPQAFRACGIKVWRTRLGGSNGFSLQKPKTVISKKKPALLRASPIIP